MMMSRTKNSFNNFARMRFFTQKYRFFFNFNCALDFTAVYTVMNRLIYSLMCYNVHTYAVTLNVVNINTRKILERFSSFNTNWTWWGEDCPQINLNILKTVIEKADYISFSKNVPMLTKSCGLIRHKTTVVISFKHGFVLSRDSCELRPLRLKRRARNL